MNNKLLRTLKISLIIVLGGMLIPALLSIIFAGFRINLISIVNFEFFVGLLIALVGGALIVTDYSKFRKKVLKTPMDREVESEDDEEKLNWPYILFCTGLIVVLLAMALGEI